MFGNPSQPSRIYSYGAKAPIIGAEVVDQQMRLAHQYRNQLVELELKRRNMVDEALIRLSPQLAKIEADIVAMEARLENSRAAIRAARQKDRTRKEMPGEAKQARADKTALKQLRASRKVMRKLLFASGPWQDAQQEISARATEEQKHLRAASGLYWGTYLHVEQSMQSAKREAPPRFHRWTGEGHLAVQVIRGIPTSNAYGEDTRIRIVDDDSRWSEVYFRVNSDDHGSPIWAVVPIRLHRLMPPEARIKWIHLVRRQVATRSQWHVQFVLSADERVWEKNDRARDGIVALDVGWRMKMDGSMRVAFWSGSDEGSDELVLDASWLSQMRRVEHIRSSRDKALDAMKSELAPKLRDASPPEWLAKHALNLHAWRSASRFAGLAIRWRNDRFPGDEDAFSLIESWRARDRHLYEFEGNLRDQLQRRRLDIYRNFAATMRRRYRTATIEDLDFRSFHLLPKDEEEAAVGALREHTRDACLSSLMQAVSESMDVIKVDAKNTTKRCWWCWSRYAVETMEDWNHSQLMHTCSVCGTTYDQDDCAAKNLLNVASAEVLE